MKRKKKNLIHSVPSIRKIRVYFSVSEGKIKSHMIGNGREPIALLKMVLGLNKHTRLMTAFVKSHAELYEIVGEGSVCPCMKSGMH